MALCEWGINIYALLGIHDAEKGAVIQYDPGGGIRVPENPSQRIV